MSEVEKTDTKQEIITKYLEIVAEKGVLPTYSTFILDSISKDKIKYHFGNIEGLHEHMHENYQDKLDQYIVTEHTVFSHIKTKELDESLKSFKRFVITTVISGKKIQQDFYNSIKNYCELKNAKLICIPALDIANRKSFNNFQFPKELINESFIQKDTKLNDNLFISSIKLSAKHIQPTTGLSRIGQRNGSYIFASPKQFLEYVVNSPEKESLPHAIMTTGAITVADYNNDRYMSDRTSYIATNDHVIGGLVVEIQDDKTFHFRQIQSDDQGRFVDLGVEYSAEETRRVETTLVMGDLHVGEMDMKVFAATKELIDYAQVKNVFVHDAFSGYSISHYDENSPHKRAKKFNDRKSWLQQEIVEGVFTLSKIADWIPGNVYRVKGNHDEWLQRYLERAGYINDPENHLFALKLAVAYLEGRDPVKEAFEMVAKDLPYDISRIVWLQRDDRIKVSGIELAQHGDKGLNGSKGSLPSIEKAYGEAVVGHTHSAAIFRGVYRVGTTTKLKLSYNDGPSNWTHTHALVYDNGHRQLINFFDGKWKL